MKARKWIAAFMAALLTLSCLICCGKDDKGNDDTTVTTTGIGNATTETDDGTYPKPEVMDLDGFVCNIATFDYLYDIVYPEEVGSDAVSEVVYNSMLGIEGEYNADFEVIKLGNFPDVTAAVSTAALSGINDFSISYSHDCQTVANALRGCFLDLRANGSFDFDAPWYTETTELFTIHDKLYFNSSHFTYSGINGAHIICYNKDLAKDKNIEIPYDDVHEGNWYMDDLINLTKDTNEDINGDGEINYDDDRYGFTTTPLGMVIWQSSMGSTSLTKDESGALVFNFDTEHFIKVFENMQKLMENGIDAKDTNEWGTSLFTDGRAIFADLQITYINSYLRYSDIKYGYLPIPKLDETQKEYVSGAYDQFWAIPKPAFEDIDQISALMEAVSYNSYNYVIPVVWETALKIKLSDDPVDAKTFDIIRDTIQVDLGYSFNEDNVALNNLVWGLTRANPSRLSSFVDINARAAKEYINKLNETYQKIP